MPRDSRNRGEYSGRDYSREETQPRNYALSSSTSASQEGSSSRSSKRQHIQTAKSQTDTSRWSKYRTPKKSDVSEEEGDRQKNASGRIKVEGESRRFHTFRRTNEEINGARGGSSTDTRSTIVKVERSQETETMATRKRIHPNIDVDSSDDDSQRSGIPGRELLKKRAKRAVLADSSDDEKGGDDVIFVVEKKTSFTRNGLKAIFREEDREDAQKIKRLETEIEALKKENEKLKNEQKGLEDMSKTLSDTVDENEKKQCDALNKALEDTLSCSVCSEVFVDAKVTSCGHLFCDYCLTKWLRSNGTCPLCREAIGEGASVEAINDAVIRLTMLMSSEGAVRRFNLIEERKKEMDRFLSEPPPPRSPSLFGFGSSDEGLFRMIAELSGGMSNESYSDSDSITSPSRSYITRFGLRSIGSISPPRYSYNRSDFSSSDSNISSIHSNSNSNISEQIDEMVQDHEARIREILTPPPYSPLLRTPMPSPSPPLSVVFNTRSPNYFSSDEESISSYPVRNFSPMSRQSSASEDDEDEVWLSGDSHAVEPDRVRDDEEAIQDDQVINIFYEEDNEEDDGGDEDEEGNYEEEDYGEEEDSVRASPDYSPYMDQLDEVEHFGDDEGNDSYAGADDYYY